MRMKLIIGSNQFFKNTQYQSILCQHDPSNNIILQGEDIDHSNYESYEALIEAYISQGMRCFSFVGIQSEATLLFLIRMCNVIGNGYPDILFVMLTNQAFTHFTSQNIYLFPIPEIYFYN